ncbi:MAG: hypothetical protein OEY49_18270 [Candidatus Heimdallarchaeota archaeon]|nr:hypothetical protein [Candidatus Heimdallarchaeota archaeon]
MDSLDEISSAAEPKLITTRWRDIKTAIYELASMHDKELVFRALIKHREKHTAAPTLTEITNFTGYDVAIHTIQRWDWIPQVSNANNLDIDCLEIGRYGAELMALHTLRESIKNELLIWNGEELMETERGLKHFQTLNSFNVDITGSRMDIAKKRFSQGRLSKSQRRMDPVNKIPLVKRLYWENSILMLLRAPLPFYQAMQNLSSDELATLIDIHTIILNKKGKESTDLVKLKLNKGTKQADVLKKLDSNYLDHERKPKFVACVQSTAEDETKLEFHLGLGALTMFTMFLLGFDRDHLDKKARRAEEAVKEVIEHSGWWRVVESNIDVIPEDGEVITEIDILAQSTKNIEEFLAIEVKDFSFWRGWVWGHGADLRRKYYQKAVDKISIKESFLKEKYNCKSLKSIIVTSIPEPLNYLQEVPLIYLSDLSEELSKLSGVQYSPRKRHTSSNFLIRYFNRIKQDYEKSFKLHQPLIDREHEIQRINKEIESCKDEYDRVLDVYNRLKSECDTLLVSEKLASKRLLKDTGDKHYQLEEELIHIRTKIKKINRDRKLKAISLKDLKTKYETLKDNLLKEKNEIVKINKSIERFLSPRIF